MTGTTLRVLCAPNAFKGTLTAAAAARAMAAGVVEAGGAPMQLPVADGGDGTLDVLLASAGDEARIAVVEATGPLGEPVPARLGWIGSTAVVELAEVDGLRLVHGRLDALRATSRGVGEMIRAALEGGASRVVVGVGGSASTDGGAGLMQALGAHLLDEDGREIEDGGIALLRLQHVDLSAVHPGLATAVVDVAVDVRSPLLGPRGAAAIFGPQKGASREDVVLLEKALKRLAAVAERDCDSRALAEVPGAGAAGGCGFGLALMGARLRPGAPLVCDDVHFDRALSDADVVLTGEGRLDSQTAEGKAPAEVAARARAADIPCIAIAGEVVDEPQGFTRVIALGSIAGQRDPIADAALLVSHAARLALEPL